MTDLSRRKLLISGVAATAVHGETYWAAVLDPMVWSVLAMTSPAPLPTQARLAREEWNASYSPVLMAFSAKLLQTMTSLIALATSPARSPLIRCSCRAAPSIRILSPSPLLLPTPNQAGPPAPTPWPGWSPATTEAE